ncbi:MAG: Rod shape-determining protein RodA, partial [Microgenomates bacterium 39_7]
MKWIIPVGCVLLAGISIVTLRSIAPELMQRQLLYFVIGFICFGLINMARYQDLLKLSGLFYILMILSLVMLLLIGSATRSTVRWIDLFGGFKVQPSQFAPLFISMFLANLWPVIISQGQRGLFKFLAIILVTSRPSELLGTVLSRCRNLRFFPLPQEELNYILEEIPSITPQKLHLILSTASGSPGR